MIKCGGCRAFIYNRDYFESGTGCSENLKEQEI